MIERLKDEISDIEFQPNNIVNYSKNLSLYVYYIRSKSPSTSRNWQQIVEQYPSDSSMLALLDSGATEAEIINDLELFDDQFKEGCNLYASERVLAAFPAPSCSENERLNKNLQKIVGPLLGLGNTSASLRQRLNHIRRNYRRSNDRIFRGLNQCPRRQRHRPRVPRGMSFSMDRENFRYYCNEDFFQVYDQKVIDVFSGESSNNLQHIYNIPRRTLAAHQSRRGVTEAQKQRIQQVTDAFYESLDTSCFPRTDGELRELNFERRSECLIAYQEKF